MSEVKNLPRHKHTVEVESLDIQTLYRDVSDDDYRQLVEGMELFYVDHHEVLRCARSGMPFATTREQFDIFIRGLEALRDRLEPRGK